MKLISCFFTSIEKKKSNKAVEEGNFALPNISVKITIFYYLMPNILEYIYVYIYIVLSDNGYPIMCDANCHDCNCATIKCKKNHVALCIYAVYIYMLYTCYTCMSYSVLALCTTNGVLSNKKIPSH